jgi:hypothetical protein
MLKEDTETGKEEIIGYSDIDETILIKITPDGEKAKYKLNDSLIQAWKEAGIRKIVLVTNTGISDINRIDEIANEPTLYHPPCLKEYDPDHSGYSHIPRPFIVAYLEKQGFEPVTLITGADPDYGQGPGRAYKDLLFPKYKEAINHAQDLSKEPPHPNSIQKVSTKKTPFEKHKDNLENYYKNITFPEEVSPKDREKWNKAIAKTKMFEYAIKSKLFDSAKAVIYFEDEETSIDNVSKHYESQPGPKNYHLSTCHVQQNLQSKQSKEYYSTEISKNKFVKEREQINTFKQKLQKLIDSKESTYNPFFRSNESEVKKEVLTNLLSNIEAAMNNNGKNTTIREVIDNWEKSDSSVSGKASVWKAESKGNTNTWEENKRFTNKQIISHHRNIFFSRVRPEKLTSTEVAIEDLKKNYGNIKLRSCVQKR